MIRRAIEKYKILAGAAIFAVLVMHFVWQFSFIQKENLRNVETSLKSTEPDVPLTQPQIAEVKPEIRKDQQPDELQSEKPLVEVETAPEAKKIVENSAEKNSQPAEFRQPVGKKISPAINKKAVRESAAERLRRAEKLLTGF